MYGSDPQRVDKCLLHQHNFTWIRKFLKTEHISWTFGNQPASWQCSHWMWCSQPFWIKALSFCSRMASKAPVKSHASHWIKTRQPACCICCAYCTSHTIACGATWNSGRKYAMFSQPHSMKHCARCYCGTLLPSNNCSAVHWAHKLLLLFGWMLAPLLQSWFVVLLCLSSLNQPVCRKISPN